MSTALLPALKAPFPYYGGKSRAAGLIWSALGDVGNFVEPFAGSLAVLLSRPHTPRIETCNDRDALLCNVWRALAADPEAVAAWCAMPPNEADQHAIHTWLVGQRETFTARLMGDPDYYDAQVAGRWLYGICCWIGAGWCSGQGPWQSVEDEEGYRQLVDTRLEGATRLAGQGVSKRLVHLGDAGQGVHRQLPHLGNAGQGVHRQLPHLGDAGKGVHRQLPHLGGQGSGGGTCYGIGVHSKAAHDGGLYAWFAALHARLRYVRVCCGDWTRVLGPSVTYKHGLTGVLLDSPYSRDERDGVYNHDSPTIAEEVRQWALANGDNPLLRIALCGYETPAYTMPDRWQKVGWKTNGGYGNQGNGRGRANSAREVIWFSPACLEVTL